jgi:hypothetical protein
MTREHGGTACMAQEYHVDGDVDGLLHKISNAGVTDVNEWTTCYMGREMEGTDVTRGRGRVTSWLRGVVLWYR